MNLIDAPIKDALFLNANGTRNYQSVVNTDTWINWFNSLTRAVNTLTSNSNASMVYPTAGIALSTGTAWATSLPDHHANWDSAFTERRQWDGGNTNIVASTGRTSLGLGTIATSNKTEFIPYSNAVTFPGVVTANAYHLSDGSDKNYDLSVYATGTAYTMSNTSALLTFGTTSPSLTINKAGTYLLIARARVDNVNTTTGTAHTLEFKLRRTNNTAADISNSACSFIEQHEASLTDTACDIVLPHVIYTTVNANDVIELWGDVTVVPAVGTHQAIEASIVAIRLY